jgi:DNA processing protein
VDEVPGFWVGAATVGQSVDLVAVAAKAGGWAAVLADPRSALAAGGVPHAKVEAWMRTPPAGTLGWWTCLAHEGYPAALRELASPPPVLFVEGAPEALQGAAIGVVGTRSCTRYGRGVARHLGAAAAARGLVVVSGLARGIDGEAHEGALREGRTVAVLGHGLGFTSPTSHWRLRAQIVESGGAMVSSWPDDAPPRTYTFPQRNQWISGLSRAVVVVEAGERSGASITARCALEQGREVYAVPGPIGAPASVGCLRLLQDGAHPLCDVDAFVQQWAVTPARSREGWLSDLFSGLTIEALAQRRGLSTLEVLRELTRMEIEGRVVRLPGQRYAPAGRSDGPGEPRPADRPGSALPPDGAGPRPPG